jgi:hypothetical protein
VSKVAASVSALGQLVVVPLLASSVLKPCGPSFILRGGMDRRWLPAISPVYLVGLPWHMVSFSSSVICCSMARARCAGSSEDATAAVHASSSSSSSGGGGCMGRGSIEAVLHASAPASFEQEVGGVYAGDVYMQVLLRVPCVMRGVCRDGRRRGEEQQRRRR